MYCKLGGLWVSYHAEIFPKAASVDEIAEICIYLVLRTSRLTMRMTCYRIAGNFHGRKLSIIGGKKLFAEKTFVDCLLVPPYPQILLRKFSRIATKLQIYKRFLPRKFPTIQYEAKEN